MRVYLAGPMRGIPEFNTPAFNAAAAQLRDLGYEVFNPADNDRENGFDPTGMTGTEDLSGSGFSLRDMLHDDLAWIAKNAELIFVLDGWQNSSGVKAEVALARALNVPVVPVGSAADFTDVESARQFDVGNTTSYASGGFVKGGSYASGGFVKGGNIFNSFITPVDDERNERIMRATAKRLGLRPPAAGEVRTTSSTGGQKGVKPQQFNLVPWTSIAHLAEHFAVGAAKYDAHQWRQGYEWSKSFDALLRHLFAFWEGEDIDEETGSHHIDAVMWHASVLRFFIDNYPEHDNRPDHPERRPE